jgi:hypothetical protein
MFAYNSVTKFIPCLNEFFPNGEISSNLAKTDNGLGTQGGP